MATPTAAPDDYDLWTSLSRGKTDISLEGIDLRLKEDNPESTAFVKTICDTVRQEGFAATFASTGSASLSTASTQNTPLPAAFETTSGKKHLNALTNLSGLSEATAVTLTLLALSSVNGGNLQSLLGTQKLLLTTLETYFQQRTARLGILTELLLLNVDDSNQNKVLEELDQSCKINGGERGLFSMLVYIAMAPAILASRAQLLPLQDICADEFFMRHVLELQSQQRTVERQQALEGLLALLYSHMQTECADLATIVVALQQCTPGPFFAASEKLASLAGLLCVEAVGLNQSGDRPFFGDKEAQLMANMVMNLSPQVIQRREQQAGKMIAAPESLLMLAVGLTLKLAAKDIAMECLTLANDCGAFEYLQFVVDSLLPRSSGSLGTFREDTASFVDPVRNQTPLLAAAAPELDANLVIYTSIGLELLGTTVSALQEFLAMPDNLTALCHLGASLYANQPIVCEGFWANKEMNQLLEAAYEMSAFWELMSSVCFDGKSANHVMNMIPPGRVREALTAAGQASPEDAYKVIEALGRIAKFDEASVREALSTEPSVLFQIMSFYSTHQGVQEAALLLLSSLVKGSVEYAMAVSHYLGGQSTTSLLGKFLSSANPKQIIASAAIFESLANETTSFCFNGTSTEAQILNYLQVVVKAGFSSLQSFDDIFAFSSKQPKIEYHSAYLKITGMSKLMAALRVLSDVHKSTKVREAASEARRVMLEAFATSTAFGQALAYFSVAPVSLSIGLMLEQTLEEAKLLETATEEFALDDATNPLGNWHSMLQKNESPLGKLVSERLSDLKSMPLDLARIQSRGWSDDGMMLMHVADAAMALLKVWTIEAEFHARDLDGLLAKVSPFALLFSSAVVPPNLKAEPKLGALWPTGGLTTYDVIVFYLDGTTVGDEDLPVHASLDLLLATGNHAKQCGGYVGRTFLPASPLYDAMNARVERISDLLSSKNEPGTAVAVTAMRQGEMFVELLCTISEANPSAAKALLDYKSGALSTHLIDAVQFVASDTDAVPEAATRLSFAAASLRACHLAGNSKALDLNLASLVSLANGADPSASDLAAQALAILSELALAGESSSAQTFGICEASTLSYGACMEAVVKITGRFEKYAQQCNSQMLVSSSFISLCSNGADARAVAKALRFPSGNGEEVDRDVGELVRALRAVRFQFDGVVTMVKHFQVILGSESSAIPMETREKLAQFILKKMDEFVNLTNELGAHVAQATRILDVVGNLSSLLLHLAATETGTTYNGEEILASLSFFAANLPSMGGDSLNNLLAVAAMILRTKQDGGMDLSRFVSIVGKAMKSDDMAVGKSSLALLSVVLGRQANSEGKIGRFVSEMKKHGIVASLAAAANNMSVKSIKDKDTFDQAQVEMLDSILAILFSIANLGEKDDQVLTLFNTSTLTNLLIGNPLFAQSAARWATESGDANYRGYLKSSKKRSNSGMESAGVLCLSGQKDPVHSVWRTAIRLVTTFARLGSRYDNSALVKLAHEFVRDFGGLLQSSLVQCGAVLTLNLVEEVWNVLELLSEANEKANDFVDPCLNVVCSLGKFLGSIGTAKLLFQLVSEVAKEEDPNAALNSQMLHPSFANGIANARFEAIRYSHAARKSYAMVTSTEYELFSDGPAATDGNDLELTCKKLISNRYCEAIETAVAKAMVSALTLVNKRHPAARCFIPFSVVENRQFNPRSIVSDGSIIAAKTDDGVVFGHVESCDTVRRTWTLATLESVSGGKAGENIKISFDDLAGVEDALKRKHLFQYSAAPDTATALENHAVQSWTIGHLILILRWCRFQNADELRQHVSESAATLLATELALHSENDCHKGAKESVTKQINDQLYDVFGARQNLKNYMTPDLFQLLVTRQFQSRLSLAEKTRQEKQEALEARLRESDPWQMYS